MENSTFEKGTLVIVPTRDGRRTGIVQPLTDSQGRSFFTELVRVVFLSPLSNGSEVGLFSPDFVERAVWLGRVPINLRKLVMVDPNATLEDLRDILVDDDAVFYHAEYVWDHILGEPEEFTAEQLAASMRESVRARIKELES